MKVDTWGIHRRTMPRRGTLRRGVLLLAALGLVACTTTPPPEIPLHASERYVERLAGQWVGSYWSAATGRRGRITFQLELDEGIAHGEVIMIPASADQYEPAYEPHDRRPSPRPLHIEIVRAADNQVTGTLEPYDDPECGCLLATSFTGTIRDDTIEGEFLSLGGPGHTRHTGRWQVKRKTQR